MKQIKKIILSFIILFLTIRLADAGCVSPYGVYVGSGYGAVYDKNGTFVEYITGTVSVNVYSNLTSGSYARVTYSIKIASAATNYTAPVSNFVEVSNKTFDTTKCTGKASLSTGEGFTFASSNSGAAITFSYSSTSNYVVLINGVLNKI